MPRDVSASARDKAPDCTAPSPDAIKRAEEAEKAAQAVKVAPVAPVAEKSKGK